MELRILALLILSILLLSCEKEIDIEVPQGPSKIVVEGQIEQGSGPIIILTRSQAFFDPVDLDAVANNIISDAEVKIVVNDNDTVIIPAVCTGSLPDSVKQRLAEQSGLDFLASDADICVYTSLDPRVRGFIGNSYQLFVNANGERVSARTVIPPSIPLDSIWYKKEGTRDTLGFVWSKLSDPAGKYNAYRWFAKRISTYQSGPNKGEMKDPIFVAPFGSAFEDEFFDGLQFDFVFNRGVIPGSDKEDDKSTEAGFFKEGDTIAVKFTTIDRDVYQYFKTYYTAVGNTGSPFAAPTNIKTNISGGLGIWAGYGVSHDTLVAKPE